MIFTQLSGSWDRKKGPRDSPQGWYEQYLPESIPEVESGGDRGTHPSARTICTRVSPLVLKSEEIFPTQNEKEKVLSQKRERQNQFKSKCP